jgi:hypothetical protein
LCQLEPPLPSPLSVVALVEAHHLPAAVPYVGADDDRGKPRHEVATVDGAAAERVGTGVDGVEAVGVLEELSSSSSSSSSLRE